ncbi:DUF4310 family protein [Brevibacillus laterosporus]|uniref:DUF4310 family protein n=1 Tax=Brevibacillus laterosporus TaxID=1465 RepID=A0AAP8QI73_BRELA|nr:DUF4310 family protein [Brevibacillus laterosporus]MBG9774819.1 membrane protein [Brevibacillus laterosporus]MBG9798816.1 membrane protein [Brevibacillus laterosporus]MBG9802185.1 membrane protein [Brevibacillus laterosporus]MCR8935985.1 DUF4310 family protein [Brevibacillus laterosporus]MCZ0838624.1 DUF4310 family protein [Brevibacillus laterosporus]
MDQSLEKQGFWMSEWAFPIFVACLCSGIFAGTHMYYVHHVGAFNDIAIVAMLEAGIKGGSYGAAAAFGASFLFARVLEGPLVGILDIGGALQTGIGIGVPAMLLGAGIVAPIESFPLALVVGAGLGLLIGVIIILIRRYTVAGSTSTFGADVMMGAGNAAGRYLGPLIVIAAIMASIPVGIGATIGAALFYAFKKPIAGGAIIGAMIMGGIFPIPT